ncbi:MAG: hypothetical protein KAJ43_05140, partial [Gemmatimonadetes bacterium]|nr:hypothetical protein [Gemmatimonadota bacterium]
MSRRWIAALAFLALVNPTPAEAQEAAPDSAFGRIEGPVVIMPGAGFDLTIEATAIQAAGHIRIRTATGRIIARRDIEMGGSGPFEFEGLTVEGAEDLPLTAVGGRSNEIGTFETRVLPAWISLLPPLLAIVLALVFKEVVTSLFVGVWLGGFFYAGLNPITGTMRAIDTFITPVLVNYDHAAILVFSFLLGGMVGVISKSGGTQGIVEAVRPLATTPRRAQLATYLSGLAIFFDDYANTLIVGNTMRPITDRMKVSREKLAYIVDSTAAPVAAIVFVSTWVGFEISLIGDGLAAAAAQSGTQPELAAALGSANAFTIFIHSIPYLFYPLLALLMVGLIVFLQRDFGPMLKAERRASRGEGLHREGAMLMSEAGSDKMEPAEGAPLRWYNAVLPVLTVVLVVLLGLYLQGRSNLGRPGTMWEIFGEASAFDALLWGSLAGCIVAIALAVGQRIL